MKRQGAGDAWRHAQMCQNSICKQPKMRRTTSEIMGNTLQSLDCSEFQQPAKAPAESIETEQFSSTVFA